MNVCSLLFIIAHSCLISLTAAKFLSTYRAHYIPPPLRYDSKGRTKRDLSDTDSLSTTTSRPSYVTNVTATAGPQCDNCEYLQQRRMHRQLKEKQRKQEIEEEQAENAAVAEAMKREAEADHEKRLRMMEENIAAIEAQQKAKEAEKQRELEEDRKLGGYLPIGQFSEDAIAAENVWVEFMWLCIHSNISLLSSSSSSSSSFFVIVRCTLYLSLLLFAIHIFISLSSIHLSLLLPPSLSLHPSPFFSGATPTLS